jgi:4-hydroxy-4-methyl-2-oxoglutarate aldolase
MKLDEIKTRLANLETSLLCDADKDLRVMDPGIRPVRSDLLLVGTAYTVTCHDDFLTVIQALQEAESGDVLVIDGQGGKRALAGELFATEAARKGIDGIVVDGAVRDVETLRKLDIPVYSRGFFPTSGTTAKLFETGIPVACGGVLVRTGDVIFGDQDGVIVGSQHHLAELIPVAEAIQAKEEEALARMARGETLLDMLNFDDHREKVRAGHVSSLKFTI